nr:hypothetical protein [uncultured Desulfobacter sp.]
MPSISDFKYLKNVVEGCSFRNSTPQKIDALLEKVELFDIRSGLNIYTAQRKEMILHLRTIKAEFEASKKRNFKIFFAIILCLLGALPSYILLFKG